MPLKPPLIGALVWAGLATVSARISPLPGEALPLRWLRKVEEHPVRGSLAFALLVWALRKAPKAQKTPLTAPGGGSGEGKGGYGSLGRPPETTMPHQGP